MAPHTVEWNFLQSDVLASDVNLILWRHVSVQLEIFHVAIQDSPRQSKIVQDSLRQSKTV